MMINSMDDLRKQLLEMRGYYVSKTEEIAKKKAGRKMIYETGKAHGALEVCDTLFLAAFGGKDLLTVMEMSWEAQEIARELNDEKAEEHDDDTD